MNCDVLTKSDRIWGSDQCRVGVLMDSCCGFYPPPGRDSNPRISSLTNRRPQPLNQVDQSSESSAMLFLKKSTSCSRRNPPYVVGEIPLLVNKLLQVSSRARYSTSDELWTRGWRETKQNLQLFSLASIIQLSLFAGMNLPFLLSLTPASLL